jgi:hypothetical protein
MASANFTAMKARLNLRLRNTNNRILSDPEVVEVLSNAYYDPFVYQISRDSSTTSVANQAQYQVPQVLDQVLDLFLDTNSDGYGDHIDGSAWEQMGDQIYFQRNHKGLLPGHPLIMVGIQRFSVNSLIPTLLQDYVLTIAEIGAVDMFRAGYAGFFLKNSVSMAELISHLGTLRQEAERLRAAIVVQRPVSI